MSQAETPSSRSRESSSRHPLLPAASIRSTQFVSVNDVNSTSASPLSQFGQARPHSSQEGLFYEMSNTPSPSQIDVPAMPSPMPPVLEADSTTEGETRPIGTPEALPVQMVGPIAMTEQISLSGIPDIPSACITAEITPFAPTPTFMDRMLGFLFGRGIPKQLAKVPQTIQERQRYARCHSIVEITRVLHGSWGGQPATLIGFGLTYSRSSAVSKATVHIRVESGAGSDGDIVRWRPLEAYVGTMEVEESQSRAHEETGGGGGGFPGGQVNVSAGRSSTTSRSFQRQAQFLLDVFGTRSQDVPGLIIRMTENAVDPRGVINRVPVACVIRHDGKPFALQASSSVKRRLRKRVPTSLQLAYNRSPQIWIDPSSPSILGVVDADDHLRAFLAAHPQCDFKQMEAETWRRVADYTDIKGDDRGVSVLVLPVQLGGAHTYR